LVPVALVGEEATNQISETTLLAYADQALSAYGLAL
jgi:hypothetical protein